MMHGISQSKIKDTNEIHYDVGKENKKADAGMLEPYRILGKVIPF